MNYERVIDATYNYFSFKRDIWFLVFFWIAFPIIVLIPWAVEKNFFGTGSRMSLLVVYEVVYLIAVLGFIILNNIALSKKNISTQKLTVRKFILLFPLVFVELWYLFIWNMTSKNVRITQLILLVGIPLFSVYYATVKTPFIFGSLVVFLFAYVLIVIHNFVRLLFTVPLYLSKDISIFEAPLESWRLTHNKFQSVLIALTLALGVIAIIFFFSSLILAIVADFALSNFFIGRISQELALRGAYLFSLAPAMICYYFAISEMFSQLLKEKESSGRINTMLAKKVFAEKKFAYKPKAKSKLKIKKRK